MLSAGDARDGRIDIHCLNQRPGGIALSCKPCRNAVNPTGPCSHMGTQFTRAEKVLVEASWMSLDQGSPGDADMQSIRFCRVSMGRGSPDERES